MDRAALIEEYKSTRTLTEKLCEDLLVEDYVIQSMDDVSPPKWHLGHTTWFFETFILNKYTDYKNPHSIFSYIFNSYYLGIGTPYPRNKRGLLARPSVKQVYEYRNEIDDQIKNLINNCSSNILMELHPLIILGINHEQQHQELLLMDIKYNFYLDPGLPAYSQKSLIIDGNIAPIKKRFLDIDGGLIDIGHQGNGFCFDNELPRHQKYILPFSISNTLVSNQEYLEFIADSGYSNPNLWLSDGWDWLQNNKIIAPLYWQFKDNQWMHFTLRGLQPLHMTEPVSHVSYFEADAFARWKGCRLPTEEEWEQATNQLQLTESNGNLMKNKLADLEPIDPQESNAQQFFGNLWEWTSSAYLPYPGYKPLKGNVGEYNGKFMNNQRVLRGGSFATPRSHIRASYRNFYGPDKRWPFSGIRIVRDN